METQLKTCPPKPSLGACTSQSHKTHATLHTDGLRQAPRLEDLKALGLKRLAVLMKLAYWYPAVVAMQLKQQWNQELL